MKNRNLMLCLSLMAMLLSGCAKNTDFSAASNENRIADTDSSSQSAAVSSPEETAAAQTTEAQKQILQMNGIDMLIPEGFQDENQYGYSLHGKTMGDEKIYIDYLFYNTYSDQEKQELALEELPDFFNTLLLYSVRNCYDTNSGKFLMTADSHEAATILDCDARFETGHIHVNDDTPDLYYEIYYAMIPLKLYDGIKFPSCWIAFGKDTEENRAEMDAALQIFAGQAKEN